MPNLGTVYEFVCNSKGEHNDDANVILEEMLCRRVLGALRVVIVSARLFHMLFYGGPGRKYVLPVDKGHYKYSR